jgi:hypothetical protein
MTHRSRTDAPTSGKLEVGGKGILSHQHPDYVPPGVLFGQFRAKIAKFAKLRIATVRVCHKRGHHSHDSRSRGSQTTKHEIGLVRDIAADDRAVASQ